IDRATHDGPGTDDRYLHSEIFEVARLRAGQHRDLRPRLNLEDTHRIAAADVVVDLFVVVRDAAQVLHMAAMRGDQVDALLDSTQHAEPQEVDLDHPRVVDAVLV